MLAKVCLKRFRFVLYAALFFLITLHITDRTNSGLIATICIWFALPLAFIAFVWWIYACIRDIVRFFKSGTVPEDAPTWAERAVWWVQDELAEIASLDDRGKVRFFLFRVGGVALAALGLVLIVLAASSVAGILNGLMVTRLTIVPFIATLVSQSLWRGCAYLLCDGRPIAISDAGLKSLGNGMVFGSVPYPVIMTILLFAVFAFVLSSTKFGRSIFAIGGNAEAARLAGINSNRIKIICYVMTSVFAAMAGIILASRMFSGQPAASPNLHFDAITACNLAGVSMVGGVGSIPSVALGVILVQAFNSGLNMAGVSQYWQYVARAALLFGSLAIDFYRQRNRQKRLLADSMKNL